jgi:pimeloyl-ACP methyl ester carboxylesterase
VLLGIVGLFVVALAAALVLVATPEPPLPAPRDVFGFAARGQPPADLPPLKRYPARDGEALAYRLYDSPSNRVLIFIHGSSYHGAGYHLLASAISAGGLAKVVLPNLRGHYQSGRRRGDVDYVGQYEDDIEDLIRYLRVQDMTGPVTLGGHSSGAGLAIRFAGGAYASEVSSYLLLSPIIPLSKTLRSGDAGGWSNIHLKRLYGLIALNATGITGFNGLPVIAFNKPPEFWDGTETLSYSYRLNASYHPRPRFHNDLKALAPRTLVLIGAKDEAIDADALRELMADDAPQAQMKILPDINHFGIFQERAALDVAALWLRGLPESR